MLWNKLMIAFDNSELALKAVEYVGRVLSGCPELEVALVGLYEKVPEHDIPQERSPFYKEVHGRLASLETDREQGRGFIANARQHLIKLGFAEDKIEVIYRAKKQSLVKDLAALIREKGYGTIVLGHPDRILTGLAKEVPGVALISMS